MQPDQPLSAYIIRETLIGGVINAFFSLIFVSIAFCRTRNNLHDR